MLSEKEKHDLTAAMEHLAEPHMPLRALPHLAKLAESGTDISIDYTTLATLGVPVIIADRRRSPPLPVDVLSPRQVEVCELLVQGLSNKAIAATLNISPATVKDHVHAILQRLGLQSRTEIMAYLHGNKS